MDTAFYSIRGGPLEISGGGAKNSQCMIFFPVQVVCRIIFFDMEGLHEFFFSKGPLIRETISFNLSRNIVAL